MFLKLWLVAAQPVVAAGHAAYDDRLFLNLATRLLKGKWLGPYSQFTLMKGPMYPLWIAATVLAGIPLPLAQHLLYLFACALLVLALRPCFRADWQPFVLFALLWWQPMSYEGAHLGRVIRQNLYTPVTLLLFAGLCALQTRRAANGRVRLAWGLLLASSAAVFWLTREEGVWILPGAALLVAAAIWNAWAAEKTLHRLLVPITAAVICFLGIVGAVCALNYRHYGWFGTVEFHAPEFLAAYGALQRPISSEEIPYVPVTRETRLRLYAVSPSFAELQPFLEGPIGLGWAKNSEFVTKRAAAEREIAGGWFMWALRDAVVAAGHGHSAREALDFYRRIATEVNGACDDGRLGATRPRRDTMMPRWRPEYTQRVPEAALGYIEYFLLFRDFSAAPAASHGDARSLMLFRDLTRWHLARSPEAPELDLPWQTRVDRGRLAALQAIGGGFRWICAGLAITGLGAWIGGVVKVIRGRTNIYLFVVATAAVGSALGAMLVNFLVDALSFPNRTPLALAPAYPLLVLFGFTAWMGAMYSREIRPSN